MKFDKPIALVAALLLAASLLSSCGAKDKSAAPDASKAPAGDTKADKGQAAEKPAPSGQVTLDDAAMQAEGVKTARVEEAQPIASRVTLTATIEPNRDRFAHVAARVPGRIVKVEARTGDTVRAGQTLALLDSVEVGEASAVFQQADSQHRVAQADFDRANRLYREEVVPRKEFLRSQAEAEKSRAALDAARQKLRMMGIEPSGSPHSTLPVTAPFAGMVIAKEAVLGELATPEKAIFTVADLSVVWIEANLAESDLARVHAGAQAIVRTAAYPEEQFEGRLAYVGDVVDRETRTVKARVEVPNRERRLKPGMFGTASIETSERRPAVSVPSDAVVLVDNASMVFVRKGGGFEARPVELGDTIGGRRVVKAGVRPGDEVVVAGTYALKSRMLKSRIGDAD